MYKCIKEFSLELYDEYGFPIENEYITIEKSSIWYIPENEDYRTIDGEVRLEDGEMGWIEITKETLKNNFKEVL